MITSAGVAERSDNTFETEGSEARRVDTATADAPVAREPRAGHGADEPRSEALSAGRSLSGSPLAALRFALGSHSRKAEKISPEIPENGGGGAADFEEFDVEDLEPYSVDEDLDAVAAGASAEPVPAPVDPENMLLSLEELAKALGYSTPTLRRWREAGMPVAERGGPGKPYKFRLSDCVEWHKNFEAARAEAEAARRANLDQLAMQDLLGQDAMQTEGAGGALSPAQRKEYLQAEVARVKLAEMKGELVRFADVLDEWTRSNAIFRDAMRQLPDELMARFGLDPQVADAMAERIDDALLDLAQVIENLGEVEAV